jgi:cellulose synthase operon protein YhjU
MNQPKGEMDQSINKFYQSELKRTIHFDQRGLEAENFDIIFLHICSLSWDDLKGIGLDKDPFFQQFDLLFTQFNTVTSYSTPSAIRLLKGSCGQQTHERLYQDSSPDCYLADVLKKEGYESYFALNHDGVYGHFSDDLQSFGHLIPPVRPENSPLQAYNFDGSPIYDDDSVLEHVWKIRQESKNPRSFIYYNTISLHEGANRKGDPEWSKKDRNDRYRFFLQKLFQDMTKFIREVESSGKNSVIVFIPEHGMALRANPIQPAGLREIPLPQITIVPAGIKLIRKDHRQILPFQQIISKPASYLSLSFLLSSFMKENPFQPQTPASESIRSSDPRFIDWSDRVPETDFVSENEETRVIKIGQDYFSLTKGKQWIKLSW